MSDAISPQAPEMNTAPRSKVRVWDPLVRVFHWGLVAAFATAWLTADELQPVHEFAGYTVAGLVAFRLVWGLVGSRYARFAQFLKGPGETLAYLGDMTRGRERRYLGHNPAGAAMVVALLVTLSGTAFTGWLMEDEARLAMLPSMPAIVAQTRGPRGQLGHLAVLGWLRGLPHPRGDLRPPPPAPDGRRHPRPDRRPVVRPPGGVGRVCLLRQ